MAEETIQRVLKQYYGHTAFRPGQEELIQGILAGRDALGVMPTGGGKSLCYQIPALLLPGLTLVVSPLISLMKDQVAALEEAGIPAAFLNSSLDGEAFRRVCREIHRGAYKLLYVAPERLLSEGFAAMMGEQPIAQVAVDEAHCISQWGQDFRPSYLKIRDFLAGLPQRPVVSAFTATATAEVQEDILTQLGLQDPVKVVTGFDRPNLFFDVRRPEKKQPLLLSLVEARREKSGIVYCATRAGVEKVCDLLCQQGIPATRYHAGLSEAERRQNQDDFQYDRKTVMVATNAFGMGIDKSNVGFVIHYNMPKSLEAYYQEAGRAGRDGEPAECILLYGQGDVTTAQFFLQQAGEHHEALTPQQAAQVQYRDQLRLEDMVAYCKTKACLRGKLLDYFGQAHPAACGHCGNCRGEFVTEDITRQAQIVLSCIQRIHRKLGYHVGVSLLTKVLRGSRDRRVLSLGLDSLSTYGLLKGESADQIRQYLETLEGAGYLRTETEHSTLRFTERTGEVLFQGATVTMTHRKTEPLPAKGKAPKPAKAPQADEALLDRLKKVRVRVAKEAGLPSTWSSPTPPWQIWPAAGPGPWRSSWKSPGWGRSKQRSTARPSSGPWRSMRRGRHEPRPPDAAALAAVRCRRASWPHRGPGGAAEPAGRPAPSLYRGGRPGLPHGHDGGGPRGGLPLCHRLGGCGHREFEPLPPGEHPPLRGGTGLLPGPGLLGPGDHDLGGGGSLPVGLCPHGSAANLRRALCPKPFLLPGAGEGWVPAGGHSPPERGEGRGSAGYEALCPPAGRPPLTQDEETCEKTRLPVCS